MTATMTPCEAAVVAEIAAAEVDAEDAAEAFASELFASESSALVFV